MTGGHFIALETHLALVLENYILIPHSTIMESVNLGMGPALLHDGWMYFRHVWYSDQLPWAADECKLEFVCVPNLSTVPPLLSGRLGTLDPSLDDRGSK